MKTPFSIASRLALLSTIISFLTLGSKSLHADALDKTSSFSPSVTFSESHKETVISTRDPDDTSIIYREVVATESTSVSIVASMEGLDPDEIDDTTSYSINIGDIAYTGVLADDQNYEVGKNSIFIPAQGWDDSTPPKPIGTQGLRIAWTATKLTIGITGSTAQGEIPGSIAMSNFIGTPDSSARDNSQSVSLTFGTVEAASRVIYASGKSTSSDVHYGPADSGDDFTLNNVSMAGGCEYGAPTVTLSSPKNGSITGPDVSITGKASDAYALEGVEYSVNPDPSNPEWTDVGTIDIGELANPDNLWGNSVGSWALDLTGLPPGSNKVWLRSRDASGNYSQVLVLTYVNSVPEELQGRWDGLLVPDNAEDIAGAVTYSISANGYYTGKILLEDATIAFNGYLLPDGTIFNHVIRAGRPDLLLSGDLIGAQSNTDGVLIVGGLDDDTGATLASFKAHRSPFSSAVAKQAPAELAGRFHAATETPTVVTLGHSYFVITTTRSGSASVACSMADGTAFTWNGYLGSLNGNGVLPVFYPLYGGKGSFSALFTIDNPARTVTTPAVAWVRPPADKDKQFPTGFILELGLIANSVYTAPLAKTRVMGLPEVLPTTLPNAQINVIGEAVTPALSQTFNVTDKNAIVMPASKLTVTPQINPQGFVLTLSATTGLATNTTNCKFKLPGTTTYASYNYLIIGNQAYGFYVAPAATGNTAKRFGTVTWGAIPPP